MLYPDNYWSDSFGPKCDSPVFGVLHLPKYFGNLSNFISHAIPKFQKTSVIDRGNTNDTIVLKIHQKMSNAVISSTEGGVSSQLANDIIVLKTHQQLSSIVISGMKGGVSSQLANNTIVLKTHQ